MLGVKQVLPTANSAPNLTNAAASVWELTPRPRSMQVLLDGSLSLQTAEKIVGTPLPPIQATAGQRCLTGASTSAVTPPRPITDSVLTAGLWEEVHQPPDQNNKVPGHLHYVHCHSICTKHIHTHMYSCT